MFTDNTQLCETGQYDMAFVFDYGSSVILSITNNRHIMTGESQDTSWFASCWLDISGNNILARDCNFSKTTITAYLNADYIPRRILNKLKTQQQWQCKITKEKTIDGFDMILITIK